MEKNTLFEMGQKLGLSKSEVKAAIYKNRYKILVGIIVGFAFVFRLNMGYQPLHYIAPSVKDFDFFMRYF